MEVNLILVMTYISLLVLLATYCFWKLFLENLPYLLLPTVKIIKRRLAVQDCVLLGSSFKTCFLIFER